jgi:hypothetical protein
VGGAVDGEVTAGEGGGGGGQHSLADLENGGGGCARCLAVAVVRPAAEGERSCRAGLDGRWVIDRRRVRKKPSG